MKIVDLKTNPRSFFGLFIIVLSLLISSCGSNTKKVAYFDGIHDVTIKSKYPPNVESPIQLNDLLSITVSSANPTASAIFNAPNESTPSTNQATSGNTLTVGYLVNLNGDIQFPVLGKIHAADLTKTQLQNLLVKQLIDTKQLVDPIVTIRQLNFRVSVLGEVTHPGVFTTPNEKISLLEALSFAGDITIYGKKDNVLLIREDDKGDRLVARIDLTSRDLFTSPYYYLRSNDVLYIEPSKNREKKERFAQMTPIILSVISLAIIIVNAIQYRN
jgi:polysaccharide export outer membrane protein